ncbi:DNA gyrase subunit A, partial [Candidatus Azambacteria bacterium]|nr:DNA gyrase subunit A [Candidatus Azambacteria bacterium]
ANNNDLTKIIKGPDFPTGGMIYNKKEINQAYETGRGSILMRGRAEIIQEGKYHQIIISEIPYTVCKSSLVEKIASLAQDKKIDGVRDIRDESDKDGMRIVIDLKSDSQPAKILNQLYEFTDLQKTFHMNILALVDGIEPRTLSLMEVLNEFLKFRQGVVTRRTQFELDRARERFHILEGLAKALDHIDAVIKIIRASKDRETAKINLMKKFDFSDLQATAILEMRLQALVNLEANKIKDELEEKRKLIKELMAILKDPKRILTIIKNELKITSEKFADKRRTQVIASGIADFSEEDLIKDEEVIISLSSDGYIKRVKADIFRVQNRGGKGVSGGAPEEGDETSSQLFFASSHDILLFFSNFGKIYQNRAYEVPEGSRTARGKAILNIFNLSTNEKINSVLRIGSKDKNNQKYLILATKSGIIKKTDLSYYANIKGRGIIAIKLKGDDELVSVKISSGEDDLILITKLGQAIRFKESKIKPMGRNSSGTKGIRLGKSDSVVAFDAFGKNRKKVLMISQLGFAKQTDLKEYRLQNRGGAGSKASKINAKTGDISVALVYSQEEDLIITSTKGQVIRLKITAVPVLKRTSQGVRVLKLNKGDMISSAVVL